MSRIFLIIIFFLTPLLGTSQLLDKTFNSKGYKYINYIDDTKSYIDEESTNLIEVYLKDPFSGSILIKNNLGQVLRKYDLKANIEPFQDGISLWIYEDSFLEGDTSNSLFSISIYHLASIGFGILIKNENKTLEQFYNLDELN